MTLWRDPELEKELCVEGLDSESAERAFSHLTRYLQRPLPEIAAKYWEQKQTADAHAQRRAVQADDGTELNRYYQETPQYLYELSYWESTRDKQKWFEVLQKACRKWDRRRVLDFGGGVGGLTLSLQRAGIACDHLDVPGNTFSYAGWRFEQERFPVRMLRATEPLPREEYDAVFAWDVFEHLHDLPAALDQLRDLLQPGGWLVSKSTFSESEQHHIHLEKNRIYNDIQVWNRLLREKGFDYVGQLKSGRLSRLLEKTFGWHHPLSVRIVSKLKHGGNFLIHEKRRVRS